MGLEIKWTIFANRELIKIYTYFKENISKRTAKKIVSGITQEVKILQKQPEIGQVEQLLKGEKENFRYLLSKKNYKIVYWINLERNFIEIVDVFDTRQNPIKMNKKR